MSKKLDRKAARTRYSFVTEAIALNDLWAALDLLDRCEAVLCSIQFASHDYEGVPECPVCEFGHVIHADDCTLATLLRDLGVTDG